MKKTLLIALLILFSVNFSRSYDNKKAHRDFNVAIATKFKDLKANWPEFKNYNFGFELVKITGPAVTVSGYKSVTTEDRNLTILDWIKEGGYSADEPEIQAAYRHFYDPTSNDGKTHLTDLNSVLSQFNPDVDAVFWHFMGNDINGSNEWSWHKGKEYMSKAIAESDVKTKEQYLAKAFRALGEVLHNTADMACPPHVRNDAHGGFGLGASDPYEGNFDPAWIKAYEGNSCDPALKNQLKSAQSAMDVNKQLAAFTNKYFFSDETISGTGVEQYSSRNGKKDFSSPKLDKLTYNEETFNYTYDFPSGRKVQLCNDQSVLLGFLTQNYRSYPRVTLQNSQSQASELVPAILEAGINVMHHFFPVLGIALEIKSKEKTIQGTISHTTTSEYPNTLKYNGKVSFLVDGKISSVTAQASNGTFSLTETDKKFPNAKKIVAYIELADIMIKSDESDLNANSVFNKFDFGWTLAVKAKATNLQTNEVTNYPVGNAAGSGFSGSITKKDNVYSGSWNITDKNPKSEGSVKITLDGEKTAVVEFTWNVSYANGDYSKLSIVTKALPFGYKSADGSITFSTDNAFKYISQYSEKIKNGNTLWENTLVEKDVNNLTGGLSVTLYVN